MKKLIATVGLAFAVLIPAQAAHAAPAAGSLRSQCHQSPGGWTCTPTGSLWRKCHQAPGGWVCHATFAGLKWHPVARPLPVLQ